MENNVLLSILAILVVIALVFNVVVLVKPAEVKTIAVNQTVPVMTPYNDSAIRSDIAAVKASVTKDDNFKASALELAAAQFNEKGYKDLYNFMDSQNISIFEKSDISSVVVRDSLVNSFDVNEKNAVVTQNLKVYFEDRNGDKQKLYIDVETTIEGNEVTDQVFSLA